MTPPNHSRHSRVYDDLKFYQDRAYTGMRVGGTHIWRYAPGTWTEEKRTPDRWAVNYDCTKTRARPAPEGSGAHVGTTFHWLVVADQVATKQDKDAYTTSLRGVKYKVGHQGPRAADLSYARCDAVGYRARVVAILEDILARLKSAPRGTGKRPRGTPGRLRDFF